MNQRRSPLLIPQERGIIFRVIICTALFGLGIWMLVLTAHGLSRGSLLYIHYFGTRELVYRDANPVDFWAGVVTYLGIAAWFFYAAVAEIVYTWRKHKATH